MGLFTRKSLTSDEYADLSSKIIKSNTDIAMLKGDMERLEHRMKSLHSTVARKKRELNEDDEEQEKSPPTEAELQEMQMALLGMGGRNN